jgi:hypothetical protein
VAGCGIRGAGPQQRLERLFSGLGLSGQQLQFGQQPSGFRMMGTPRKYLLQTRTRRGQIARLHRRQRGLDLGPIAAGLKFAYGFLAAASPLPTHVRSVRLGQFPACAAGQQDQQG